MGIVWTIIIGFVVGVVAKFLMPGKNEPTGFILTPFLVSSVPSLPAFLDNPSAIMRPAKA